MLTAAKVHQEGPIQVLVVDQRGMYPGHRLVFQYKVTDIFIATKQVVRFLINQKFLENDFIVINTLILLDKL